MRQTLAESERALMCVAFVHPRGLFLLREELQKLKPRQAARLLLTTTFQETDAPLEAAASHGLEVKILNPRPGSTYHPKVYLGLGEGRAQAVVGSANLTSGLATNVEAGVWMRGRLDDGPLEQIHDWAESIWNDPRARPWRPGAATSESADTLELELLTGIVAAWKQDPVFWTLGSRPQKNLVVDVTPAEVLVETERSKSLRGGPASVPAMMLNLAWDYLRAHRRLTNTALLNELRVHRSSAVCAILARLPNVQRAPGKHIELLWTGP